MKQCPICRVYVDDYARYCTNCGHDFNRESSRMNDSVPPRVDEGYDDGRNNAFDSCGPEGKSRGIAALLAIFLGYFGVQYFYLGKVQAGIISIVLSVVTCGLWELVTFVQGILMLCMSNSEFRRKFVTTTSTFPVF